MYQRNRGYQLVVGDSKSGNALVIHDLQITFDCSKSSDNTTHGDSCVIEIYNLSDESLKYFEGSYIYAEFTIGYKEIGIKKLFSGNVTQVTTRKNGTDRVTQIIMGSGYVELNYTILNKVVPGGKTIKDVIEEVRGQMPGVVRGIYAGTNINNQVLYGYPLSGTPKELLQEIGRANQVEWRIDNNILYVNDTKGSISKNVAFVFSKETGLIEIPYKTSGSVNGDLKKGGRKPANPKSTTSTTSKIIPGVQFKALLNPEILPGSVIKLESEEITGFYKVDSVRFYGDYRGNDWCMECFCSDKINVET